MTTISPNRRKNKTRGKTFATALALVVGIGAVIIWRNAFGGAVWHAAEPILHARTFLTQGASSFLASQFSTKAALVRENEELRQALASTSIRLLDRDALFEENLALKRRLGRESLSAPSILARVLMRPPGVPYDTLVIDVGAREGVKAGDVVSPGGSVAVGVVSIVNPSTSRVTLFSAPGMSYKAQVYPKTGQPIELTVTGQGGGSMRGRVPAGLTVSIGDRIVLPGLTPELRGTVSYIDRKQEDSFETIYFHLPVNLFELTTLEVRPPSVY